MAERLSIRGHEDENDWVREIIYHHDGGEEVLGMVNAATGQYTPPELLEIVQECKTHIVLGVRQTLDKAKIPMTQEDFKKNGLNIKIE